VRALPNVLELFAVRPGIGLAALVLTLAGCATSGKGAYPALTGGMEPALVQGLWGEPSAIQEYDDSDGHHVRWEYHRNAVGEQGYWSLELQQIGGRGYTTTAVRRGRPYTQKYLAAWVVFTRGEAVRWQTYEPPTEEPAWMRSTRGVQSRSSRLIYP
jgi:hypothetical protein